MENALTQSLNAKESLAAIISSRSDMIKILIENSISPGWYVFEHFIFKTLGEGETNIRTGSLFFLVGTIFFVFKIASNSFNKKTAVIASLLTLFNPLFFLSGFEGLSYSVTAFGVSASFYFFLRRFWKRYITFTWIALYSHHTAVLAVLVQVMWALYELAFGERKVAKKMLKKILIVTIGYLPWLYPLSKLIHAVGPVDNKGNVLVTLVFDFLAEGIKQEYTIPLIDIKPYKLTLVLIIISLLVRNWVKNIRNSIFFLSLFLLPNLLAYFLAQKVTSVFLDRHLIYTIPWAMLILATSKRGVASFITLILILSMYISADLNYFLNPGNLPFREYSKFVKQDLNKADYTINWYSDGTHHLWESKYYKVDAPVYLTDQEQLPLLTNMRSIVANSDIISKIPDDKKRVGVITSGDPKSVKISGFYQDEVKEFGRLKYVLLVKNDEFD